MAHDRPDSRGIILLTQQQQHEFEPLGRIIDNTESLHIASAAYKPSSSTLAMTSPRSASASARNYAKYIRAAKRHHTASTSSSSDHLRASTSSTASTMSAMSSSTASSTSSRSSSSNARRRRPSQHDSNTNDTSKHPPAASPSTATAHVITELDPDYLPIDSTQYKQAAHKKKKRRAQRIKLKHYGLAKAAAKLNNLSGFVLHSITPRESSILTYTSMTSPGTHTEYDIVVENVRTGMLWQVARRYSAFRHLRDELLKPFQAPHCHYCASVMRDMHLLESHFPGKRLWGSTKPSVVTQRAERFQRYLHGLLAIATSSYKLNCRVIAHVFVNQLRCFLTTDSVRYTGIPGAMGETIPCLLHELSTTTPSTVTAVLATMTLSRSRLDAHSTTLQTIQEHASRSSRGSLLDDVDVVLGHDTTNQQQQQQRKRSTMRPSIDATTRNDSNCCDVQDAYVDIEKASWRSLEAYLEDAEDDDDAFDVMEEADDNQEQHASLRTT